jgi:hypothetical protein
MSGLHGTDDPPEEIWRRKAAGDVVHQDDAVVVTERCQAGLHRSRPIHAAGHDIQAGATSARAMVAGDLTAFFQVGAGSHDDDVSDLRTTKSAPQCVSQ